MIRQLELIWFRRKLFWIGLVGFGIIVPIALSMVVAGAFDEADATSELESVGWYASLFALIAITSIVGVILGAINGVVDHREGMTRYIALTGTSRPIHGLKRALGALGVWLAVVVVGTVGITAVAAASGQFEGAENPVGLWLTTIIPGASLLLIAFGVSRAIGSQGMAIALVLGVSWVLEPILSFLPKFGDVWVEISLATAHDTVGSMESFLMDTEGPQGNLQAWLLISLWTLGALALGPAHRSAA